jgi:hypothetical protein
MGGLTCTLCSMPNQPAQTADGDDGEAIPLALQALRTAVAAVDAIPDAQQALERGGELARSLQAISQELDEIRRRKAAAIWEAEELSLAGLADRVAVPDSRKSRAPQPTSEDPKPGASSHEEDSPDPESP